MKTSEETVLTFGEDPGAGAQFIFGADRELGVGAYWGNDGHMAYLSLNEAKQLLENLTTWVREMQQR